jgi:hypothetical protein
VYIIDSDIIGNKGISVPIILAATDAASRHKGVDDGGFVDGKPRWPANIRAAGLERRPGPRDGRSQRVVDVIHR